ncbi:hypothetical protein THAOC_20741, partial [Thalassiosira oceanica]
AANGAGAAGDLPGVAARTPAAPKRKCEPPTAAAAQQGPTTSGQCLVQSYCRHARTFAGLASSGVMAHPCLRSPSRSGSGPDAAPAIFPTYYLCPLPDLLPEARGYL